MDQIYNKYKLVDKNLLSTSKLWLKSFDGLQGQNLDKAAPCLACHILHPVIQGVFFNEYLTFKCIIRIPMTFSPHCRQENLGE